VSRPMEPWWRPPPAGAWGALEKRSLCGSPWPTSLSQPSRARQALHRCWWVHMPAVVPVIVVAAAAVPAGLAGAVGVSGASRWTPNPDESTTSTPTLARRPGDVPLSLVGPTRVARVSVARVVVVCKEALALVRTRVGLPCRCRLVPRQLMLQPPALPLGHPRCKRELRRYSCLPSCPQLRLDAPVSPRLAARRRRRRRSCGPPLWTRGLVARTTTTR
jgi:hypothetical protein